MHKIWTIFEAFHTGLLNCAGSIVINLQKCYMLSLMVVHNIT